MSTVATGFVLVTSVLSLASLALLRPAYQNREKPGAVGVIVIIISISCYAVASTVRAGFGIPTELGYSLSVDFVVINFIMLGVSGAAVGWLLLALERTGEVSLSRWVIGAWLIYPVVIQLVVLRWPLLFLVYILITYTLIVAITALLIYHTAAAGGVRRQRGLALTVAVFPPFVGFLPFLIGVIQTDPTPLGFTISSAVLGWALFYADFLNITPVGRQRVYEQMDDPAVTIDRDRRVVDCNAAARSLTGIDSDWEGMAAAEFFEPLPDAFRDALSNDESVTETEISASIDGMEQHFVLNSQPIVEEEGAGLGRFILLQDVTPLKKRESELDLMQQVQSRVLRHNIKNKLTVVAGHTESLATELDGEAEQRAQRVIEATGDLLSTSEKARAVEQLFEESREPQRVNLAFALQSLVTLKRREFPNVDFETDFGDATVVETIPAIEIAFENLIENAAEHNEGPEQVVEVSITEKEGDTLVSVRDTGPGIPEHELSVIEQGEETQLEHGSGIGLWLINWVIEHSAATITYRTSEDGTTAVIQIPDRSTRSNETDNL
jgi:PAS domain S-box-containing protein